MSKKIVCRIVSIASAAVLLAGATAMFSACTSDKPQVTITYEFNGNEYKVDYTLSRSDSPKTVQHFIELADAGYYDGTCIHNYTSTALYGGGYYFDGQGELTEKDYFAVVRELEKEGNEFTQSVYYNNVPLYTVYGEFIDNGVDNAVARNFVHSKGALVMYYSDKSESAEGIEVSVTRNDGGKNNDNISEQEIPYATNSATSLFYTYLGTSNTTLDKKYAVFGKTDDFDGQMQPLLDAIDAYKGGLEDDESTENIDESSFTESIKKYPDALDHHAGVDVFEGIASVFEGVRKSRLEATYSTPRVMPIIIKSVKVVKY